jgi:hypothetical protein
MADNEKGWADLQAATAKLQGHTEATSAWDRLQAELRGFGLLEWRTPVERARDVIREAAEVLRQHGEADTADKLIAVVGSGRQPGHPRSYPDDDCHQLLRDVHDLVVRQYRPSLRQASGRLAEREPYKSRGQSMDAIRVRYGECWRRVWETIPADNRPAKRPTASQMIRSIWKQGNEVEGNLKD